MRVDIEMVDAFGIERGRAPLDAVNGITLFQKELGKIAAILARDACDKGRLPACATSGTAN